MVDEPIVRDKSTLLGMPWYDVSPWKKGEVERVFRLRADRDSEVLLPGLVVKQYRLSAIPVDFEEKDLCEETKKLFRCLSLFQHYDRKPLSILTELSQKDPELYTIVETLAHVPKRTLKQSRSELKPMKLTKQQIQLHEIIGLEKGLKQRLEKCCEERGGSGAVE